MRALVIVGELEDGRKVAVEQETLTYVLSWKSRAQLKGERKPPTLTQSRGYPAHTCRGERMAENGVVLVDPAYAVSDDAEATPASTQQWPSQDDDYLCECARQHWVIADEAESEWRDQALDDMRFAHGEQWHPALLQARKDRQCLVIDRSGTPLRQIVNEGRQNRLGIVVSPAGNGATMETAKTIKGLIRNIEQQSTADIAYTTARTAAVTIGRGYVRVLPVYTDDFSFEQELRIVPVRNVFSVRLDPRHTMPDASDINWFFVVDRVSRSTYEQEFGKLPAEECGLGGHRRLLAHLGRGAGGGILVARVASRWTWCSSMTAW